MKKWNKVNDKYHITAEFAQYLFNYSKNAVKNREDFYDLYNTYGLSHSIIACIEGGAHYANGRWNTDFNIKEKTWYRIGDIYYDYYFDDFAPSRNHSNDTKELGVSVIDKDWLKTISSMFFDVSRGIYEVKGIQVGWGSDGEPVIVPTSIPKYVGNNLEFLKII